MMPPQPAAETCRAALAAETLLAELAASQRRVAELESLSMKLAERIALCSEILGRLAEKRHTKKASPLASRIPLWMHKQTLVDFFKSQAGGTVAVSRHMIVQVTGIPAGSLSEILSGDEFEQTVRGYWRLAEER